MDLSPRSAFTQHFNVDPAVLKTVLAFQEKAFRSALEIFMKQVEYNVQALQSTVSELLAG